MKGFAVALHNAPSCRPHSNPYSVKKEVQTYRTINHFLYPLLFIMYKYRFLLSALLFSVICFTVGCGDGHTVTGKVTFPDGTPLTVGKVMFSDGSKTAFGDLNEKGEYRLGMEKAGGGIPAGTYQVYITGALIEGDPAFAETLEDGTKVTPRILAIDHKFTVPSRSDLTCKVNGKTTFDIPVEKPPANYNPYLKPN